MQAASSINFQAPSDSRGFCFLERFGRAENPIRHPVSWKLLVVFELSARLKVRPTDFARIARI